MRAKDFLKRINEDTGDGEEASAVVAEVIKLIGEGHTEVSPDVITTKVSAALGRPFMLKDLVAANNSSPELQHYIDSINPTKIKFSTDILTVKNEDPMKEKQAAQDGVAKMAARASSRPRLGESDQGISKSAETKFHKKLDTLVHDTFGKRKEEMKENVDKVYTINITRSRMMGPSSTRTTSGTLAELIDGFSYTLEVGKSYEHERGRYKINMNPKTIQQLVDNLNKAKSNAAANGHSSTYYEVGEQVNEHWDQEGYDPRGQDPTLKPGQKALKGKPVKAKAAGNLAKDALDKAFGGTAKELTKNLTIKKDVDEAGDSPIEKTLGMGDSRSAKELKDQIRNLSTDTLNAWHKDLSKGPAQLHSKVAQMQLKLINSELRRRGLTEGEQPGEYSRILRAFEVYTNTMGHGMDFYNWAKQPDSLAILAQKAGTTPERVVHALETLDWGQFPEDFYDAPEDEEVTEAWGFGPKPYKGWTYDVWEDDDGDVRKKFHSAKKDSQEVSMDWTPYSTPSQQDWELWIDLGMPTREQLGLRGPIRSEDLLAMAKTKQGGQGLKEMRKLAGL